MIVSFDFDDTLCMSEMDKKLWDYKRSADGCIVVHLNKTIANKLIEYKTNGDTVYIVTTRYAIWREDTEQFLKDNSLMGYIDAVVFTNGEWKVETLERLNVDIHYDDNPQELSRIADTLIIGIKVKYE